MKQKKCRICSEQFTPRTSMHIVCSVDCSRKYAEKLKEKEKGRRATQERIEKREKRAELKTRREWLKDAQAAFNAFIRYRDKDKPCISCGRPLAASSIGGGYDAGHYRSVGSAPHLRFEPFNCHAQCKQCNRYKSGNAVDYRLGLITRIGLINVELLEADQEPRKFSIDDLKEIIATCKSKLKELKRL